MSERRYYVYFLTNQRNTVLYVGVTNDIARRVEEHKAKVVRGFTTKYNVDKLVYAEVFESPMAAITREKQIKGGSRAKKIALIERDNPEWKDLSDTL